jgi:uncharacterized protein (TIGR01777 family)
MTQNFHGQTIVIAGGSGFLGVSLAHFLAERNADVVILSRHPPKSYGPWRHLPWDARTLGEWSAALDGAAGIVNLAGRSVNCVKTPDHQDEILRSRVESTRVLGVAMRTVCNPPPVWVQMSTAHIYGDPPRALCTEDSAFGYGLAPYVGRAWEEALRESLLPSQRAVVLRTSFVLGRDRGAGGGALTTLARLARWGLGGRVGHGEQGFSWIHEDDLNRLFTRALIDREMEGAYIASAPNPVSQRAFMNALRCALRMPLGLPAAEWMVRLGARWLLRSDPELALYGRYVRSLRLEKEGFVFQWPEIRSALKNLFTTVVASSATTEPVRAQS